MCTNPNYLLWQGKYHSTGSPKFDFIKNKKGIYDELLKKGFPFISVGCGKCLECRIQYSRQWGDRCALEALHHKHNYFITLTYDDNNLPQAWYDEKHDMHFANGSLYPRDLQLFMKRLRKRCSDQIRFFASGEYGSQDLRPHFHIVVFGLNLDDLTDKFKMLVDGKEKIHILSQPNYYFSSLIWETWLRKGMITVVPFNYHMGQYVANYVTKKIMRDYEPKLKSLNLYPEFLRMSNRPGIGASSFNKDLYIDDHIIIPSPGKAHLSSLPRYFDKLFIKKYGDDVFNNSIRSIRHLKRDERFVDYVNGCVLFDDQNRLRDIRAKATHELKTKL